MGGDKIDALCVDSIHSSVDQRDKNFYLFSHERFKVVLTKEPLNILNGINFVKSPLCGAINTFSGTVRDTDLKKDSLLHYSPIVALEYEAYCPFAFKQLINIVKSQLIDLEEEIDCVRERTRTNQNRGSHASEGFVGSKSDTSCDKIDKNAKIYLGVRFGRVDVGQEAIIICASSTSRHFSHSVTMSILENVKTNVAIWKKIMFSDGSYQWASVCKS